MEGSGEGSGGCVVHVDVHGECVTLWVAASCYWAWQVYSSVLYAETVSSTDVYYNCVGSFKLCCEILLLLNIADVDYLSYRKLWSEQC